MNIGAGALKRGERNRVRLEAKTKTLQEQRDRDLESMRAGGWSGSRSPDRFADPAPLAVSPVQTQGSVLVQKFEQRPPAAPMVEPLRVVDSAPIRVGTEQFEEARKYFQLFHETTDMNVKGEAFIKFGYAVGICQSLYGVSGTEEVARVKEVLESPISKFKYGKDHGMSQTFLDHRKQILKEFTG